MAATQSRKGGIEVRSTDYVPLNERHGKVWHFGPLWFMSNAQIATLAVGLISVSEGASLFWSVLAIVVGVLYACGVNSPSVPVTPLGRSGLQVSRLALGSWRTYERISPVIMPIASWRPTPSGGTSE